MHTLKYTLRIALLILVITLGLSVTGFFQGEIVHAQAAADAGAQALQEAKIGDVFGGSGDILINFAKILAIILRAISQLLWPLLMFAGGLMKSDFLYTGAIDIKLTEMWIQVRNLVNIVYVLLLLAVALYNVLGLGETVDFLEIKKALPKIIIGLLLVNFSYTGVKVVLDVVNVGTVFAFSIPRTDPELTIQTAKNLTDASKDVCTTLGEGASKLADKLENSKELKADAEKVKNAKNPQTTSDATKKGACVTNEKGERVLNPDVQKVISNWNIDGALMIIAIKFMHMQDLSKIAEQIKDNVTISNLLINMILSIVMYVVYGISFITLVIILFARAAILWMVVVFSPLIVLNFTFPNILAAAGGGAGDLPKKIVSTLLAPIIIGFVLSIGYILLSTMQNINYGGVTSLISDIPTSNLDTFQDFLIAIGSVVFVWMGIQGAISDAIGGSIAGGIMEAAKGAGQWLAKAPFYYTPIFQIKSPHGTHQDIVSLGTLSEAINIGKGNVQQKQRDRGRDLAEMMGFGAGIRLDSAKNQEELKAALKELGRTSSELVNDEKIRTDLIGAIDRMKNSGSLKAGSNELIQFNKLQADLKKVKDGQPIDSSSLTFLDRYNERQSATAGAQGALNSFADKKQNEGTLKDGVEYLNPGEKDKANKVINARDEATFTEESKVSDNTAAAKKAMRIGEVRESVKNEKKVEEFIKAAKAGTLTNTQKQDLKKFMDAQIKELEAAGVNDDKTQGKILGDRLKDMLKAETNNDKAKMTTIINEVKTAMDTKKASLDKELVEAVTK